MVNHAMILAAGLGTRLAPLTLERPKPLVEVLGTPLVHFALDHARRAGAERVALNTHHLHPALELALGSHYEGMELVYSYEPVLRGTGGGALGMRDVLGGLDGPTLLLNADALIDLDVESMAALHERHRPLATLALQDAPDKERYGLLGTDENGQIRSFAGRTAFRGPVARERMFCGVHLLEAAVLDVLPATGESCINREGYPRLLDDGAPLSAFDVAGYFCDVGTKARLLDANLSLLRGDTVLRHFDPFARFQREGRAFVHPMARIDPEAQLVGPVLIDAGAIIERGARVGPEVVVGRSCHIGAEASMTRTVLQSRTIVSPRARVHDAVCFPGGCLQVD